MADRGTAVVTGASSGIGAATAVRLAQEGFDVVARGPAGRAAGGGGDGVRAIGAGHRARRHRRRVGGRLLRRCRSLPGARQQRRWRPRPRPGGHADVDQWQRMYETNVLGTLRMTRALLPALVGSGDGHVVVVGSIAGVEPYAGGAGYNAAKAGEHALAEVLRRETVAQPVRVSEVLPGLVETEFSLVRFDGDEARAATVYDGLTPLTADDVADVIAFVVHPARRT